MYHSQTNKAIQSNILIRTHREREKKEMPQSQAKGIDQSH